MRPEQPRSIPRPPARRGLPLLVIVGAGLALALLVLPLVALVLRAPWDRVVEIVTGEVVGPALALSLGTAALSTLISLLLGVPLAVVLARSHGWPVVPRRLLRAAITIPLVLPPVVGGIAPHLPT